MLIVLPMFLALVASGPACASQPLPDLCRIAARDASVATGVPYDVLMAIALTETGRSRNGSLEPWPWALHLDGAGHWFDTKAEAVAMAETALQAGTTNIDLGCFQLNIRWHAENFGSAEEMISPNQNARYAADFLAGLYEETGDWSQAAGAYHSRNPAKSHPYRQKFETIRAQLQVPTGEVHAMGEMPQDDRLNRFPLLQTGAPGGIGSLVPQFTASAPLVGG